MEATSIRFNYKFNGEILNYDVQLDDEIRSIICLIKHYVKNKDFEFISADFMLKNGTVMEFNDRTSQKLKDFRSLIEYIRN